MSFCRLLAVACKEFRHIARDVRILFLVTVGPAFLLVTLSYVFAMDVDRVYVAVHDLDHTPLSRQLIASLTADGDFVVVADVRMSRVLARQQRASRRRAHRTSRVMLRKPHALCGHSIDVGRSDLFLPVTAQLAVSQIICQDINDIGFA